MSKQMAFKLAIRDEGDFVVAYYSAPRMYADPSAPPLILATFRKSLLQQTDGVFEGWQELLRRVLTQAMRELGLPEPDWKTIPGPPDERTGKA